MTDDTLPIIDLSEFAKAGEALKKLNDGQSVDLTPCGNVASVLDTIRNESVYTQLPDEVRLRLRKAVAKVSRKAERNVPAFLNFLSDAFGTTKRPDRAEPHKRERIGTFLIQVANAA